MTARNHTKKNDIATFDYLRKSTKGEVTDANGQKRERQEKSIAQQRGELDRVKFPPELELAGFTGYAVAGTYTDEGVSGWKMAERPGFQEMIAAIKLHTAKVKVIRVDNIDRFSRADIDETLEVARELKKAGVKWIVSAAQGVYAIGNGNDLVEHLKFAIAAHASHEYSKQLSRRVGLSMRNKSQEGRRMGARAPYALRSDDAKILVPGDTEQVEVVRQIFNLFVRHHKSINFISRQMNDQKIPAPRGGRWQAEVVKQLLQQPAYAGRHVYGRCRSGRFHQTGSDGELIEIREENFTTVITRKGKQVRRPPIVKNDTPTVCRHGAFEAIIEPKIFDAAQKKFEVFKSGRKPRHNGYCLSGGILRCDHCGGSMHAVTVNGGDVVYRCSSFAKRDRGGKCLPFQIRENLILPEIMRLLGEEIDALQAESLNPKPLPDLPKPDHSHKIEVLKKKIDQGVERILDIDDKKTRQTLDAKIAQMRVEVAELEAQQSDPAEEDDSHALAQLAQLWDKLKESLISTSIPADGAIAKAICPAVAAAAAQPAPWHEWQKALLGYYPGSVVRVDLDRRAVNEMLHGLGCDVRLRFRTEHGKQRSRHYFERGRIRLGQRTGQLSRSPIIGSPK